jgi:hypothetical protein
LLVEVAAVVITLAVAVVGVVIAQAQLNPLRLALRTPLLWVQAVLLARIVEQQVDLVALVQILYLTQ